MTKQKSIHLFIQIPCYNEEKTLPTTLADLPRQLEGVDRISWLVIDDGSRDKTVEAAIENGVDYVVQHPANKGLARTFETGIEACLQLGADIIVNTDADNQYNANDIPKLIEPILNSRAELVIGERPISEIEHFSTLKKFLQGLGSYVVRKFSNTDIRDAPSGFRAISRNAALKLRVYGEYTYTLETIIQAGQTGISIVGVPIGTNENTRPSRLISSIFDYIRLSATLIIRSFMAYRPLRFFIIPATISLLFSLFLGLRFLWFFMFLDEGAGHLQSLILATVLLVLGGLLFVIGLLSDLLSINRKLLERIDERVKILEYNQEKPYYSNLNIIFKKIV